MLPRLSAIIRQFCGIASATVLTATLASAEQDYAATDALYQQVARNVAASETFEIIAEIDHSRLAAKAGEDMPPSRVIIFSDPTLDAGLLALDPRIGVDLPLRVLSYEIEPGGDSTLLYSGSAFLENRFGVTVPQSLRDQYAAAMAAATKGIDAGDVVMLRDDGMDGDGLITIESPHGFEETLERLRTAISAQDDTVWFGDVDLDARAGEVGVTIGPAQLLLYGGPAPGGKAMSSAPSLGLDAFCQKALVLEDADGRVTVVMNDLLAMAERHDVGKSIPLRFINRRIQKTFNDALEN